MIIDQIKKTLKRNSLTIGKISKKIGLPTSTLSRIMNEQTKPQRVFEQFAESLDSEWVLQPKSRKGSDK